jgi:hypothetical protein
MDRIIVLQSIILKKKAKNYLEIGVCNGACFFNISIKNKTAVDPAFVFGRKVKWKHKLIAFPRRIKYYEMTSNRFFEKFAKEKYDLIFLDGLHTYKQTYKDVLNSLHYLKEDGIIVLHDCNPTNAISATPAASREHMDELFIVNEWNGEWNGDVWKTIVKLRSSHHNLNVSVLDCDFGLGLVRKANPENRLTISDEEISKMTYKDLEKDRIRLLNLKPLTYFPEFINSL